MSNEEALSLTIELLESARQVLVSIMEYPKPKQESNNDKTTTTKTLNETWVTCRQASIKTGVSMRTLQNWAKSQKVKSRRDGKLYEVVLEDVEAKAI